MNPDQFIPPFKYIDGEKAKASFLSMVERITGQPAPEFDRLSKIRVHCKKNSTRRRYSKQVRTLP